MFCSSCGNKLPDNAKFCGKCGAQVVASVQPVAAMSAATQPVLSLLELKPTASGLAELPVIITAVLAVGPDHDGDLQVTVKYTVKNSTKEDLDYLFVRTHLLDGEGRPVESTNDDMEQEISSGETAELESVFYSVKAALLGEVLEQAHAVVRVVATAKTRHKIGQVALPEAAQEPRTIAPAKLGDALRLLGGSVSVAEPDGDGDSSLAVSVLIQNVVGTYFPRVELVAPVTDRKGNELTDTGTNGEVTPGDIVSLSGSGYEKTKKLKGASADISFVVHTPVALGLARHAGMEVEAAEISERRGGGGSNATIYGNIDWFDVAEQPSDFDQLPEEFAQASQLWQQDPEGNFEEIHDLLSPYLGARFIPSNIPGYDELFVEGDEPEILASRVHVAGIDFARGPIPICKAEAWFDVPVTQAVADIDLEEWQGDNGNFSDGLAFFWNIPRTDETEDLDFAQGDNQGVECVLSLDESTGQLGIGAAAQRDEVVEILHQIEEKLRERGFLVAATGDQEADVTIAFRSLLLHGSVDPYLAVDISSSNTPDTSSDAWEEISDYVSEKFDELREELPEDLQTSLNASGGTVVRVNGRTVGFEDAGDDLQGLLVKTVSEYRADPRRTVFAGFPLLLASAREETQLELSPEDLMSTFHRYLSGDAEGQDEAIYDGAVAVCYELARQCLESEDCSVDWILGEDDYYACEISP